MTTPEQARTAETILPASAGVPTPAVYTARPGRWVPWGQFAGRWVEDKRWADIDLPVRYMHSTFEPVTGCDPEIAGWVNLLRFHGIETVQSCQGGEGHAYAEPTIDFLGDAHEGWYAASIALRAGTFEGLRPWRLSRTWHLSTGEPTDLVWQLVLWAGEDKP